MKRSPVALLTLNTMEYDENICLGTQMSRHFDRDGESFAPNGLSMRRKADAF